MADKFEDEISVSLCSNNNILKQSMLPYSSLNKQRKQMLDVKLEIF